MKRLILLITLCVISVTTNAQTSDKIKGCIPLTVKFDAPASNEYYWDFGDGNKSDSKSPEHIFTQAGAFQVKLFESMNSNIAIGEIAITVYPDLIVEIESDINVACVESMVEFQSQIEHHPEIQILEKLWSFGDGASSLGASANHRYETVDVFDVSLAVKTNLAECDKTILKKNHIRTEESKPKFSLHSTNTCTAPAIFEITNNSENIPNYTYEWDFGNGETSSEFEVEPVTYDSLGTYEISLVMTSPAGCIKTKTKTVTVGTPLIDLEFKETICKDSPLYITNNSTGFLHSWDFGPHASERTSWSSEPVITFDTAGIKEIKYNVSSGSCSSDTMFTVLVDDNAGNFIVSPESLCGNPLIWRLEALNKSMDKYYWNGSNTPDSSVIFIEYEYPERDSFYVNKLETQEFELFVKNDDGCIDTSRFEFEAQLPEAFFIPDSIIGMAPLTIGFQDFSSSTEEIHTRTWNFGDGTTLTGNDTIVHHEFKEPGRYFVKLNIATDRGCSDDSKGTVITVLGEGQLTTTGGGGDPTKCEFGEHEDIQYCVGDVVDYLVGGTGAHIDSDEGRFNSCWANTSGQHQFKFPGVFPVYADIEFEGFLLERTGELRTFEIHGARSDIGFERDCKNIYEVNLRSKSIDATMLVWRHNGKIISDKESFVYNFQEDGFHEITLEAHSQDAFCDPDIDTLMLNVSLPKAVIKVEEKMCDNVFYDLDASKSEGHFAGCRTKYLWEFEHQRPREVLNAISQHEFVKGNQKLSLTVTDENGCTDKTSTSVNVFGNELAFEIDTSICFPYNTILKNNTQGDTTITEWKWVINPDANMPPQDDTLWTNQKEPTHTFTASDLHPFKKDTVEVMLTLKDAMGCLDTLTHASRVYKPTSEIFFFDKVVCVGENLNISASDYEEEGSFLNYNWDFTPAGTRTGKNPNIAYSDPGTFDIILNYEEAGSGCGGELMTNVTVTSGPTANFASSIDSMETVCYPHTVQFQNGSTGNGLTYDWEFNNGSESDLKDPSITFGKGEFTIELEVTSNQGCKSKISKNIQLVGPSGDLYVDDVSICKGESINVELQNTNDVNSYSWDMGDGTVIQDQNPITHQYLQTGQANVVLVIKSSETACEAIKEKTIAVHDVPVSDFESSIDSLDIVCYPHLVEFTNETVCEDNTSYRWIMGNGNTSFEENPRENFGKGTFNVEMTAKTVFGCTDKIEKTFTLVGPSGDLVIDDSYICLGDSVTLELLNPDDVDEYSWDLGDGNIITEQNPVSGFYPERFTSYGAQAKLWIKSHENGCVTLKKLPIYISEVIADFELVEGTNYCEGKMEFNNLSQDATEFYWDFGDNNESTEEHPENIYEEMGKKEVTLIASDQSSGCVDSTYQIIDVFIARDVFFIPNVFSPNQDDHNDFFRPEIKEAFSSVVEVEAFQVYNRWGEVVYNDSSDEGWDGTFKGEILQPDVFAYYIELHFEGCKQVVEKGNVTILR